MFLCFLGGLMVTTLRLNSLEKTFSKSVLNGNNWCPEVYMEVLKSSGFTDVRMENRRDKRIPFQAIFATAVK